MSATLFSRFSDLNFFQGSSCEASLGLSPKCWGKWAALSPSLDHSASCRIPVLLEDPKRGDGGAWSSLRKQVVEPRKARGKSENWDACGRATIRDRRVSQPQTGPNLGGGAGRDGVCFLDKLDSYFLN